MQRAKISDKQACKLHVEVEVVSIDPLLDIKFTGDQK